MPDLLLALLALIAGCALGFVLGYVHANRQWRKIIGRDLERLAKP